MKQEGLLYFSDLHLTWVAFFLFFISFVGLVYNVSRKSNKKLYKKMAQLPLQDEKEVS